MRAATQVAGSAIDRVFTAPMDPPRRFRGTVDAALTLALGSVCAFGLTLGPAPMNTVALSAPAGSSAQGPLDPAPDTLLAPYEVDGADSGDDRLGESFRPGPPADPANTDAASPAEPHSGRSTAPLGKQARQHPPLPEPPNEIAGPEFLSQSTAFSVVENYRISAGLGAFVAAGDCEEPAVHAVVAVPPSLVLPLGLASGSLAPDPASATVAVGPGAVDVTVFRCH